MPSLGQGSAHGGLWAQPRPRLHVARPLRMTPTELFYYVVGVGKSKEYVVTHENDVTFKLPPPETALLGSATARAGTVVSAAETESGHRTKSETRAPRPLTETGGPPLPRTPSS